MWISQKRRGFTLIELLVVVAIIGILLTVAVVSLTQARRKARDTRRVSDIQQIRNALTIYSNARAVYPPAPSEIVLGVAGKCLDDSDAGFRDSCDASDGRLIIMARVPKEAAPDRRYLYQSVESDYALQFTLEGAVGNLPGGQCIANTVGITCQ